PLRRRRAVPGHEKRAVLLPPRDDRASARDGGRRAPRPGPGPVDQSFVLDPVVEGGRPNAGRDGRGAVTRSHGAGLRRLAAGAALLAAMTAAVFGGTVFLSPAKASAHPLGNFT